jgi:hypothetical protein
LPKNGTISIPERGVRLDVRINRRRPGCFRVDAIFFGHNGAAEGRPTARIAVYNVRCRCCKKIGASFRLLEL